MPAWPDVAPAIERLRSRFVVAPHPILSLAAVAHSSKAAGLPWDAIVSRDALDVIKTHPDSYRRATEVIGFPPDRICYVSAHTSDLNVVAELGMRTAFVRSRRGEYGEEPLRNRDDVDIVASDFVDLAGRLV